MIQIVNPRPRSLAATQMLLRDMFREFVVIDGAIIATGQAFVHSKSRVDFYAIFRQRKICRISEALAVLSIQVMGKTSLVTLLNMMLVPEVGRDFGSLNGESISTLTSTTNEELLVWVYIELEAGKKKVSSSFHVELNSY